MTNKNGNARKPKRYPLVEWLSAAFGVVLTLILFGLLAYEAVAQRDGVPPVLSVSPVGGVKAGGQYVVEVEVRNLSRKTAAAVPVEGLLSSGGAEVETSTVTLDYVPGESSRRASLVFTRDPRTAKLEVRATGYSEP